MNWCVGLLFILSGLLQGCSGASIAHAPLRIEAREADDALVIEYRNQSDRRVAALVPIPEPPAIYASRDGEAFVYCAFVAIPRRAKDYELECQRVVLAPHSTVSTRVPLNRLGEERWWIDSRDEDDVEFLDVERLVVAVGYWKLGAEAADVPYTLNSRMAAAEIGIQADTRVIAVQRIKESERVSGRTPMLVDVQRIAVSEPVKLSRTIRMRTNR